VLNGTNFTCYIDVDAQAHDELSITQPQWSKEALFGLLSILVVILLPALGLLLRICIAKYRPVRPFDVSTAGMRRASLLALRN